MAIELMLLFCLIPLIALSWLVVGIVFWMQISRELRLSSLIVLKAINST